MSHISRMFAKFRFKLFRLISISILGREVGQSLVGQCLSSDLEFANSVEVRRRIISRTLLSEACVQKYRLANVPECWRVMYSRVAVFPRRFAYLLRDVVIGPESGIIHAPPSRFFGGDGIVFIPSVGSHYFYMLSGIREVMRRSKTLACAEPVCPLPIIGYYHEMFEGLIRVAKAKKIFGDVMVLISDRRPRYIDEMLDLIGVKKDHIIISDRPVRVSKGALIPCWNDSGENLKSDVCAFREFLISRLICKCFGGGLYVSRAKSSRSLPNERDIELSLEARGFRIVYFEELRFAEQLCAVHSADVIVAPHGAGLANLIVARPGTTVIEIMTQGWANSCYGHLAESLGLNYSCIDADDGHLIERIMQSCYAVDATWHKMQN